MTAKFAIPLPEDIASLLDGSALMERVAKGFAIERDIETPVIRAYLAKLREDAIAAIEEFIAMPDPGADPRTARSIHYRLKSAIEFANEMANHIVDGRHAEEEARAEDEHAEADQDVTERGGSVRDSAPAAEQSPD